MIRVLFVDDEPLVREVVCDALRERLDVDIDCAASGGAAARLLARRSYDLALIDAVLPDNLAFALACVAADEAVAVLFTSGHPDATELLAAAGYPYISKPFGLDALVAALLAALGRTGENIAGVAAASRRLGVNTAAVRAAWRDARRAASVRLCAVAPAA